MAACIPSGKEHKDKDLSVEEWSLLWQSKMCAMKPINPKSSHHMASLDKWTMNAQSASVHMLSVLSCSYSHGFGCTGLVSGT